MTDAQKQLYKGLCNDLLQNIHVPADIMCGDANCTDDTHKDAINCLYNDITNSLYKEGREEGVQSQILKKNRSKYYAKFIILKNSR